MAEPVPGWYPDPDNQAQQRYWDGSRWTEDRIAAAPPPAPPSDAPPPAGWYPDPEGEPETVRYWDGTRWTEDRAPYSSTRTATGPNAVRTNDSLVAAGYILSLLIPIVGIVIGAILIQRQDRHGRWILALSLFFIAVFVTIGSLSGSG
jgi:hypothetical protein